MSDEAPCPVYRVWFEGWDLDEQALDALEHAGAVWEGTRSEPGLRYHHSVRARAASAGEAVERIASALDRRKHGNFHADLVRDGRGAPWTGAIDRSWPEVDWSAPELVTLNRLQRAVLGAMLDDHEPTWTIVQDRDVEASRIEVDEALEQLERVGLVDQRLARSFEPGDEGDDLVPWWALTDRAWDLLGIIKSPRYRP